MPRTGSPRRRGGDAGVLDVIAAQLDHGGPDDGRRMPLLFDMFAEAGRNLAMARILGQHSAAMRALLADLLRRGQARGEVDAALDPEAVAPVLMALVDGSKSLALRDPGLARPRSDEVLRVLVSRFLSPAG